MFSFHKPKVYRSSTGCCICKAKSSSSRFTDSKKYEEDFVDCFQLPEKRCGEVCNACVLLVKRWKKLPEGNGRNWRHVVDARAGPGTKSMTKFKSRNHNRPSAKRKSTDEDLEDGPVLRKKKPRKLRGRSPALCDGDEEGDETTPESSRSPTPSEEEIPHKRLTPTSGFVDITVWKRSKSCCGLVYLGPWGMTMINPRQLKMCSGVAGGGGHQGVPGGKGGGGSGAPNLASKPPYSDNSSDSGYDESSNQSICHPLCPPTN